MSGATSLQTISAYSRSLARCLSNAKPEDAYRAVISTEGKEPVLWINDKLAHSRRDPEKEGRRLVEAADGDGPLVILGFGLGYEAQAASASGRPVVIVERSAFLVRQAFQTRDLSALFACQKLYFVIGDSAPLQEVLEREKGAPALIINRAVCAPYADWYRSAAAIVEAKRSREAVNAATRRRFGQRWVRNIGINRALIAELPGVNVLENALKGIPALVIAAGPSLDTCVPLLPALAEHAVIIAVDTALRAVLRVGVQPDFVVAVDPQYWNSRHLDHCAVEGLCLVSEIAAYPSPLRLPFGRRFLCASPYPLARFLEQSVDAKGTLGAGGSVATTAWDFARLIGASPVFIAGLDLAFPETRTHFKGAYFEESALRSGRRMEPAETSDFRLFQGGFPFKALASDGKPIVSDRRLSLYAAWFEARTKRPSAPPSFRFLPALHIDGLGAAKPKELLALPECRLLLKKRLNALFDQAEKDTNSDLRRRQEAVREASAFIRGELASLRAWAQAALSTEQGNEAMPTKEIKLFENSPAKAIADFLVYDTPERPSEAYYLRLSRAASFTIQALTEKS